MPPQKQFRNHDSCRNFNGFISNEIINRVRTGAFRVWGEVGVDDPPHLALPLAAEPSKPRLCLDTPFLNLWMRDAPFSLDKLSVTRFMCLNLSQAMTTSSGQKLRNHILGSALVVCGLFALLYRLASWKISLSYTIQ